jgi:hypothetical protein
VLGLSVTVNRKLIFTTRHKRPHNPQPATLADAPRAALATELLQLCERFFTNASPAVIAELHAFLIAEGVHPATTLGWFTDTLGFATYFIPSRANDRPAAPPTAGRGVS